MLGALAILPGRAQGLSLWRERIASRWTDRPPAMDGKDPLWSQARETEENGVTFKALNDGSSLYLQVASVNRDGRALLTGVFRQDFTLWFLKPDGKTRDWGVRVPFSRLDPPASVSWEDVRHPDQAPVQTVPPEKVTWLASYASTAPLPSDIPFRSDMSGREPVYALRIPLPARSHAVAFDFAASRAAPEVERQFAGRQAKGAEAASGWVRPQREPAGARVTWNSVDENGVRRGPGGPRAARAEPDVLAMPEPAAHRFSVHLARKPPTGHE